MAIELNSARPMNVTSIDLLPAPLKDVRSQAAEQLAGMLGSMFDNADDALFELADKAVDSEDQTMYFNSMREVRIKRQVMEKLFARSLRENFKVFQRGAASKDIGQQNSEEEGSGFSLMQDDQLEESVAIRGMVSKINNLFVDSLEPLVKRMDFLASQVSIDEGNNPIGPAKLCDSFQVASQELSLNIRSKLVVYKLFEKHVLENVGDLYCSANDSLVASGVLPQLKTPKKKVSKSKAGISPVKEDRSESTNDSASADQNEVFSQLRELLANRPAQPPAGQLYLPVADSGPVLSQGELLDMLSTVQHKNETTADNLQPAAIDVRQALHRIADSRGADVPQAVGRVDDDAINLVSMLFEYILDDRSLPVTMKALLGRLQIPLLKVSLIDKSFFSRGAHPARKLLNELAHAALSWNEPADVARDPLFNKINDVVSSILNDFENDVEIFAHLLADFSQFVEQEKRRSALIEQRTRDAEEGLGKTQRARADVGRLINEKAADKSLPAVAVALLREGWSNYLFLQYVKRGVESESWQAAVRVVDDLIWSVDREAGFGRRGELLKMIPSLLKRLREGLNSISFSKNRMRELFEELENVHMSCLASPESRANNAREQSVDAINETSEAETKAAPVVLETPLLEPLDEGVPEEAGDEYTAVVDSMAVGAWHEILDGKGGKARCKLAAIVRASGKYIFVNRIGIKVAEHTRSSLIETVRTGRITMLDNALLFDRALESVIGHLREMKH